MKPRPETRSHSRYALRRSRVARPDQTTAARAPNAEERAAAEAAGFEVDPVRSAVELLPPDLLTSPHYRIDPQVVTSGIFEPVRHHVGLR